MLFGTAMSLLGCAEPLHLIDRGASAGASPYSFWPPPPGSALWLPPSSAAMRSTDFAAAALALQASLVRGGYAESRWYPIGGDYQHGFAATTRLERLSGTHATAERWSALYPDAAGLRWLTYATAPTLSGSGEYRAFLIAFTDLQMPSGSSAPVWSEQTLMDGPGAPERRTPTEAAAQHWDSSAYRFGVFEYIYDWDDERQRGKLVAIGSAKPLSAWPPALAGLSLGDAGAER